MNLSRTYAIVSGSSYTLVGLVGLACSHPGQRHADRFPVTCSTTRSFLVCVSALPRSQHSHGGVRSGRGHASPYFTCPASCPSHAAVPLGVPVDIASMLLRRYWPWPRLLYRPRPAVVADPLGL